MHGSQSYGARLVAFQRAHGVTPQFAPPPHGGLPPASRESRRAPLIGRRRRVGVVGHATLWLIVAFALVVIAWRAQQLLVEQATPVVDYSTSTVTR